VTLAARRSSTAAPGHPVDFAARLTAAGRRALRASRRLPVTLVLQATDQSGNATTIHARHTLRR